VKTSREGFPYVRASSGSVVRVGSCAPLVPFTEAPRMPRLGTSCAKPKRSTTLVSKVVAHARAAIGVERHVARLERQLGASGCDATRRVLSIQEYSKSPVGFED
jgi:hypothetical protein